MTIKTLELSIPGEFKDEPLFYNIAKNFDLIFKIMEASFSTDMGWAIVTFEGQDEQLDKLSGYLKEKHIEVKDR